MYFEGPTRRNRGILDRFVYLIHVVVPVHVLFARRLIRFYTYMYNPSSHGSCTMLVRFGQSIYQYLPFQDKLL